MAHVFSSDFGAANGSSIITSLETAVEESTNFSQTIETFRTATTTTLVGPGYNSVRNKMGVYQTALSKVASISNNLKSNIITANNFFLNAMEGYDELNTADLPELDLRIKQSYRILAILKTEVTDYKTDKDGKKVACGSHTIGSPQQISAYESLIKELEKLKEVLDKLEGNASAARGMISDSETDTLSLGTAIGDIAISVYK